MFTRKLNSKAFTLIELLVVIAIIALLLSILMPSLRKAKEAGQRVICLTNMKSLTTSWRMYADDNDDDLAEAKTTRLNMTSTSPIKFDWLRTASHPNPTWVGYKVSSDPPTSVDIEAQKACITMGTFYPYNESEKIYRCPTVQKGIFRTYSLPDSLNGFDQSGRYSGWTPIKKFTKIRSTASQIVFICEDRPGTEGWSIMPPPDIGWWDVVPYAHLGAPFSFADGHAEFWKYEDQRTRDYARQKKADPEASIPLSPFDNPDFVKIQRGIWGNASK